jgi:ABC-type branched-subunit amino acid transport system substrate-binding protein
VQREDHDRNRRPVSWCSSPFSPPCWVLQCSAAGVEMKCRCGLLVPWLLFFLSSVNSLRKVHRAVTLSSLPQREFNGTIRIGAPISVQLDDAFFSYGTSMANSWNMFVDWVNYEKGGVRIGENTYSLSLIYVEDFSNDAYVSELCQLLVDQGNLMAMFAPYSSKLTSSCSKVTEPNEMLFLAGGAADTKIYRNTDYSFGTLPSGSQYVT